MFNYKYPHPAVTADCVVFAGEWPETSILLVKRAHEPYKNYWALPGGFMNIDETTQQAAVRELQEETGLMLNSLRCTGVYDAVGRDPRERVISVAYATWLNEELPVSGGDDAAEALWVPLKKAYPLAFDHLQIIDDALSCLRDNKPFRTV